MVHNESVKVKKTKTKLKVNTRKYNKKKVKNYSNEDIIGYFKNFNTPY